MKGCQCPKALWLYKHQPELRASVSNSQQAIFDQGTSVGKLAEQLFPGGVDARPVDTYSYQQSVVARFNSDPYGCDFMDHCWQHIPEDSVFDLRGHGAGARSFELYEQGILHLKDIPDHYHLNSSQALQVQCHKSGEAHIDQQALTEFLEQLEYPLYFMDFETYQVAIPEWDGTRPYQQMPFQYSVHRQDSPGGALTHFEWLAPSGADPRKAFLSNLLAALGTEGSILVYNAAFENSRLNDLADWFPRKAKAIEALQERMVDLMSPFRSKHYYLPAMKGSYSIKQVLPALVPHMNYDELAIGNGGDASTAFYQLQFEKDASVVEQTRTALLRYCGMDTFAMHRILDILNNNILSSNL